MEESSTPLVGCSKPHLEKLTLGITRILGEWGGDPEWEGTLLDGVAPRWILNASGHLCCDFRC